MNDLIGFAVWLGLTLSVLSLFGNVVQFRRLRAERLEANNRTYSALRQGYQYLTGVSRSLAELGQLAASGQFGPEDLPELIASKVRAIGERTETGREGLALLSKDSLNRDLHDEHIRPARLDGALQEPGGSSTGAPKSDSPAPGPRSFH